MTKFWFYFLIIATVAITSKCFEPGDTHCEESGIRFLEGEKISIPNKCQEAECVNSRINQMVITGCPMYKLVAGCHTSEQDNTKPYPECCPQPICPED